MQATKLSTLLDAANALAHEQAAGPAAMDEEAGPLRVVVAGPPDIVTPFLHALPPGNDQGVEVITAVRDTIDLLQDLSTYRPQIVIIAPDVRNYSTRVVQDIARWPDFPVAVVGVVPNSGAWGSEMAAHGAVAFYNTPITPGIVAQFADAATDILARARTAWRAPLVQSGVAPAVFAGTRATAYKTGVYTFWSTKGGSGKTTLAVETACILSQVAGKRVLLVDANMNGGHVRIRLNLDASRNNLMHLATEFSLHGNQLPLDVLRSRVLPLDAYLDRRTKVVENRLDVLLGIASIRHAASKELAGRQGADYITAVLQTARAHYDFVIVDCGSSIMNGVHSGALKASDAILFICTPDKGGIGDNKDTLATLLEQGALSADRFKLVLNQFTPAGGFAVDEIAAFMGMPVFATVPLDGSQTMLRHANLGRPFALAHLDARKNSPEVEATLRGLFAIAEQLFPPLGDILHARDERFDGKRWRSRRSSRRLGGLFRRRGQRSRGRRRSRQQRERSSQGLGARDK